MELLNDSSVVYSINVDDIRNVANEEGFAHLADEEINKVADKMGDYIGWRDAIAMALNDCLPANNGVRQQGEN